MIFNTREREQQMKIQLENGDIEKVLKAFCPAVKYTDGQIQFKASGKNITIGNPDLGLKSHIAYDGISGDLDLKLDENGIRADLKLK